jgi:hypothetical protein
MADSLYSDDLKSTVRSVPGLSDKEEKYVRDVFKKGLSSGLTEGEIKRQIDRLKKNSDDSLKHRDLDRLERDLLSKVKEGNS